MMETDVSLMDVSPRAGRRSKPASRSSSIGGSGSGSGSIEYTSLRDVLVEGGDHQRGAGGSWREYSCNDIHDFDASNIGIRNQLLKHAASAYLQSAVVVASRDQSCLGRLWSQVQLRGGGGGAGRGRGGGRGRVLRRACSWQGCVDDPAELCAAFVARSARRIAAFVADRIAGIWA